MAKILIMLQCKGHKRVNLGAKIAQNGIFLANFLFSINYIFQALVKNWELTDIAIEKGMSDSRKIFVWQVVGQNSGQNIYKLHFLPID